MTSGTCPDCGARASPSARFCEQCGTSLEATAISQPNERAAQASERLEEELRRALSPQYQLVERLGRGGMGSVFLARDPTLKRTVAVKVLSPKLARDPDNRQRFRREAQAVAALSHPHVVPIYSVGEMEDGTPYFVMEHVEGGNMAERVAREGPLDVAEARRVLGEVASALEAAHAKGIIHRDVKPANILYDEETGRALVSDFGIAAVRPGSGLEGPTRITRTGTIVGTPYYMSPEQLLGEKGTEKTDVYGLGLTAYELLTGQGPYDADSPQMIQAAHLRDEPRELDSLRADVDPELKQIARACLSKDPDERPTPSELVRRLRPETGPLLEWPPPGLEPLQGRLFATSLLLLAGSLTFVLPMAVSVSLGEGATAAYLSLPQLLLASLSGIGAILLAGAMIRLLLDAGKAARAVGAGYAWGTVAEVLADFRRDTGAVIAGSREYASLSSGDRGRIRRGRLIRAGALLAAGVLPGPTLLAYLLAASHVSALPETLWAPALGPPVVLVVMGLAISWREGRRLRTVRRAFKRRSDPGEAISRLVPAWEEDFQQAARGQPGPGLRAPALLGWTVAGGGGAILALSGFLLLPTVLASLAGGTLLQVRVPLPGETQQRLALLESARPLRVPTDPTITPIEAGEALVRLSGVGGWEPRTPYERPPTNPITEPWFSPLCEEAFGEPVNLAMEEEIFRRATVGPSAFEEGELACLEELAAHPGGEAFALVARAETMDLVGARFDVPFPPDVTMWDTPIARFGTLRDGAYTRVGAAAFHLAQGDPERAELILREVIFVGLLLADDAVMLLHSLIGTVVAGIGEGALWALLEATGREEDSRRLRSVRDSVEVAVGWETEALEERWARALQDPRDIRGEFLTTLKGGSPTDLRSFRWAILLESTILPCTNPRELLFGPAPDLLEAWDRAREDLVRWPSEEEVFRLIEENLERMSRAPPTGSFSRRAARQLLGLPGRILGNPRIQGCAHDLLFF